MSDDEDATVRRLKQLEAELRTTTDEMWALVGPPDWHLQAGPVRLRGRIGSQSFALMFTLFHLVVAAVGAVLTFVGSSVESLGVALVVGALFGFGSFISQVWAQGMERERQLLRFLFGGPDSPRLRALRRRRQEVLAEIDELTDEYAAATLAGDEASSAREGVPDKDAGAS